MDSDAHLDVDLREFLRILRRRKRALFYTVAVIVGFVVGLSLTQTPVYSAATTVLIAADVRQTLDQGRQGFSSPDLLNRTLTNEISFAEGDQVRAAVRNRLGRIPDVRITAVINTDTLEFTTESTDPKRAALQANGYATAYLQERRAARTADYLNTAQTLVGEIESLRNRQAALAPTDPQNPGIRASIASLQQSLGDLRASGQLAKVGGNIVRKATPPTSPVSPNVARNGILAGLLGSVLGILLAFTRDRVDDAVTSKEELQAATGGATVMALIPRRAEPGTSSAEVVSITQPHSISAEAYRILRASIQIRDQLDGGGLRVLAVTSPGASEGKTSTVVNLGVALARTGQRTVIVDYDLRRPRVHAFFLVDSSLGIISVLLGETDLTTALQDVEDQSGLSVVAAGSVPPNPSEILSLSSARSLVQELRNHADFVLVDCPPVLPVPDALAVAQMVDGVILVAAAHRTSKRALARAVELLGQAATPIVGTVLNEVRGTAYGYGYGYGYGYSNADSSDDDIPRRRFNLARSRRNADTLPTRVKRSSAGSDEAHDDRARAESTVAGK